ncbi:MAG: flagellar assembly protein FliX [Alphaproteobacteria bacterium]|nr:flagellar assembly protein FliX [Alphaproteobacteria bacterium]
MKIESMRSLKTNGIKNKSNASKTDNASFSTALAKETSQSGDIVQLSSMQSIASLWALQEVDAAFEKKKKAIRKGHSILEELANLQKSISLGNDPKQILNGMQSLLMDRDDVGDSNLQDVLDAIYLRASVEAAKFSR